MKKIENKQSHLFIEYSEPYQLDSFIALMNDVAQECHTQDIHKVLVDIRGMPGKINFMERFQVGTQGADIFRGVAQVGIVYRKEEINTFAETVSVNRGANVRIFADSKKAKEWLEIE